MTTITHEESKLLEKRDTELTDAEREVIIDIWSDFDERMSSAQLPMARDDRAARLEAAMVRFLLESRS